MKKIFFYIIVLSQSWLSIGTFCAHIINPDHALVEIFNEEEKNEKEKEIEKEIEKIHSNEGNGLETQIQSLAITHISDSPQIIGRFHSENFTPPPEG